VIVGLFAGILVLHRYDWRLQPVAAALLAITALGALTPIGGFPNWRLRTIALLVAIEVVAVVLFWAVGHTTRPQIGRVMPWAAAAVILIGIAAGAELGPRMVRRRYAFTGDVAQYRVAAWASSVHHAKIGMINYPFGYLLTGSDYTNRVRFLADEEPHGGLAPITTCAAWRAKIDSGHFDSLVIGPSDEFTPEPFEKWTASAPNVRLVLRAGAFSVFDVTGPLSDAGCSA
jgi:hypothetical protein